MFLQEITPDTTGYMIAGFAVTFIILAAYAASLYLRNRNLKQDLDMLTEMERLAQPEPKRKTSKTVTKRKGKK